LASKAANLGPVSVFFASLKLPFLGFYFVARGLTRQTRSSAALHGGILAAGLVIVLFQFLLDADTLKKVAFGNTIAAFGWALLAYGLLFSVASAPRSVGLLLTLGVLVAECIVGPAWLPLAAGAVVALAIGLRVSRLAFLQWGVGYAAIALAARWSNGWDRGWPQDWREIPPVFECALAVGAVLLLATWQASAFAHAVERFLRDPARALRRSGSGRSGR
ncbi:MAG TPA: hypothetical protein VH328_07210, partial [Burkholderiaceae bacterium]|nr:hypothetical protein [Burkholderiaceae bacterium]